MSAPSRRPKRRRGGDDGAAREPAGSRSSELARVALVARCFAGHGSSAIGVDIGDDAAVLERPGPSSLVWTIDAQVEGTHFRLDWLGWRDVGWRSFMAAASDLAAMGASPLAALSALVLTDDVDDEALEALASGQRDASRAIGAPIVGGNLARGREASVTTTVLGSVARPVLRSGARAGDGLYLAGAVGMAAAGLRALEREKERLSMNPATAACVDAWRRPHALIDRGLSMGVVATAAIDVSDGLARDALHIAAASGVTLVLEEQALRARAPSALEEAAGALDADALDLILEGGEDYALLVASPSALEGFDLVGEVEEGPPRIVLVGIDGVRSAVEPHGFDHFGA